MLYVTFVTNAPLYPLPVTELYTAAEESYTGVALPKVAPRS